MSQATPSTTLQIAMAHHRAGRLAEAESIYRAILARDPRCAEALDLLGVIAMQVGHGNPAVDFMRQAVALSPDCARFHSNLGEAYRCQGQLDAAIASLGQALVLQPEFPAALNSLGAALVAQNRSAEAMTCLLRALQLDPRCTNAHLRLGNILMERGELERAGDCFRRELVLSPNSADTHNSLGAVLGMQGKTDEAVESIRRAIALKPDFPEAHNNLGGILIDQGRLDDAIACYQQAIALKPDYASAHSCLILALHYHSGHEPALIAAELRRWKERHATPLTPLLRPHANLPAPERRLRVGYISPDLRSHPVGWFLRPLLSNHDHQGFEIFCYSTTNRPDDFTARLRAYSDHWRELPDHSVDLIAELIRTDEIDILVDLASHTARNNLLVLARKPAPVQVTYLAYPGSTGLDVVDYRLTDPQLDPPHDKPIQGPEQPLRLRETYWCYEPVLQPTPEINPLPALSAGHVTLGSLNNACKVRPTTLEAWARILHATPRAILKLLTPPGAQRSRITAFFAGQNVDSERLCFVERGSLEEYFQSYRSIDLALDPFPFPGGTTTCDALWMGVPVVSLAGPTPVTRGGLSILSNVGLPELVAYSVDDYVAKAAALASDLPRLAELRAGLRDRMRRSPLMDAPRFARDVATAYREMWRRWCQTDDGAQK